MIKKKHLFHYFGWCIKILLLVILKVEKHFWTISIGFVPGSWSADIGNMSNSQVLNSKAAIYGKFLNFLRYSCVQ